MGKIFNKASLWAETKDRKLFVLRDLFIYISLAIFIFALFLSLTILYKDDSQGFKIAIDGKIILTHTYGQDFIVENGYEDRLEITESEDGKSFSIKLSFNQGFNLIIVNELNKTVKMQDSDCPSKNCTYMHEISSSGAIYCAPRKLMISPLYESEFITPSTGVGGAS